MATLSVLIDKKNWLPVVEKLWAQMPDAPVFYSPSMLDLLQNVQHQKMVVAVLWQENEARVALPIFSEKIVQNATYEGWDNLGVLKHHTVDRHEESKFWQLLVQQFSYIKLTCFSQNHIPFANIARVNAMSVSMRKCPYIALGNNWEELNEQLGKKLVRNIRQYGNKAASFGISFHVNKASELAITDLKAKLAQAFSYHEARMSDINQKSKFTPEIEQSYHLAVLQNAENAFVIEAKNEAKETVAFYYGLFNKSRLAWFNGGYNPEYYKYSIGTLLVANLVSWGYEQNMKVFDFLRGNESYKQKWTEKFDLNEDIYLSNNNIIRKAKLSLWYYSDLRKRIGLKNIIKHSAKG